MKLLEQTTLGEYIDAVSSSDPAPGGGSVAGVVAALASALGSMVAALSRSRSNTSQIDPLAATCAAHRHRFLQRSMDDQAAFEAVMDALQQPKEDPSRADVLEKALHHAADVPLSVAQACLDLLNDLHAMVPLASRHTVSDIGAAGHLALAALRASLLNVHINVTFMTRRSEADRFKASANRIEEAGRIRCEDIAKLVLASITST